MRIKEARKKKNLRQRELARLVDMAPSYICDLENGKVNNPSKKVMDRIAAALGESVIALFYEGGMPSDDGRLG